MGFDKRLGGPTFEDLMTPGFHSGNPETWPSRRVLGKTFDMIIEDEMTEEEPDLQGLVEKIDSLIVNSMRQFMLSEPLMVTVKTKDGGYSKRPLIGGEEFIAMGCYLGKRGKLIYTFKPVDVSNYVQMEMEEARAKKALSGFSDFLKSVVNYDLDRLKKAAQDKASIEAEREKLSEREEQYANMGFGSW